ncbi:hypothetical protein Tco_1530368 [Tanacetum coccineum]
MANLDFCDKHNMVAYLKNSEGSKGFHQIIDFLTTSHIRYALTESPTIYVSLIEQFWQTASASTLENGDMEITTTIDGKVKVVSEASIRRHLKLEDSDGHFSPQWKFLIHTILHCLSFKKTVWEQFSSNIAAIMPHDLPLPEGYTPRSDEGNMTLHKLMVLCTQLSTKVVILEADLKQTKKGRKIAQIDEDEGITLVQMSAQTQGKHEHDFEEPNFEFIAPKEDYTAEPNISTANVPVSTAGAEVSTTSPEVKTAAESLVYIRRSAAKRKDKGKAIMKEAEPVQKKTKLQLEQERLGLEEALRLQEQLDEEERQRIARVHEEASTFNAEEWDNIQAQIEADEELAHRLQAQERERYSEADKARLLVELINERKRKFAQQRAEQRRNKPMTQA